MKTSITKDNIESIKNNRIQVLLNQQGVIFCSWTDTKYPLYIHSYDLANIWKWKHYDDSFDVVLEEPNGERFSIPHDFLFIEE